MTKIASIVDVLQGKIAIGEKVTLYAVGYAPDVIPKPAYLFLPFMTVLAFLPIQAIVNMTSSIMNLKYCV